MQIAIKKTSLHVSNNVKESYHEMMIVLFKTKKKLSERRFVSMMTRLQIIALQ